MMGKAVSIAIAGVAASGKSSVAKELKSLLEKQGKKVAMISTNELANKSKVGYDRKLQSWIIDVKILRREFRSWKAKAERENQVLIVHGILAHLLPVDLVFILRVNPIELERRLKKRKYGKAKIAQNLLAEALDVILVEALQYSKRRRKKAKIAQIDCSEKSVKEIAREIESMLKKRKVKLTKVDWLGKREVVELLSLIHI